MDRVALGTGTAALVVATSLTFGCNRADSPAAPTPPSESGSTAARSDDGAAHPVGAQARSAEVYTADLRSLNAHVGYRPVDGKARFMIQDGRFVAMDEATGLQPGMIHPQHIHAAAECPPPAADANGDGFIDVIEGVPFYGAILVPLDSDLSSQAAGSFPFVHNHGGALSYREEAPYQSLIGDLNAPDPDPADAVVKLDGAALDLAGRHVVLHGVSPDTPLPPTVASLPGLPAHLTLPIACGEIQRVNR